ncbi:IclR family transcriptional regulator [Burkholderia lata]|uniref:IclR family transcriptional regulator n=1 Tax=Burkholderia lata (strain ATCC 17760 / DSM 23089 / LMG 22485 / NCIMB 9086 / R18194 / 383) TaxID=482957 RepID=UPI0014544568|nr:IclR family transcriptional regulator [Burkholderia lata]VWB87916.1 IclR family transcriptional regulator [Burkholderia lata]
MPHEAEKTTMTLERGMQVLNAFHAERIALTNGDLVQRTGLSRSVVSRLTSTLIQLGFIRRVAGGPRFELAAGIFGIGHTYLETNPVTRLAQPLMQRLADTLGAAVALAVPHRLEMLYVAHCYSVRNSTLQLGVGSLLPMSTTSIGKAWLWGLPEDARNDYIARLLKAADARAPALKASFDVAFDELDSTGVCTSIGEFQHDVYGIALPISIGRFATPMALSCGAVDLHPDIDAIRNRIAPPLKLAAAELAAALLDVPFMP